MDEKTRTRLITLTALRYGAHESGLEDLQTRVEAHFADRDFDSLDLGVYLQDLRTSEAPHLFGQRAQTPPGSPAAVRAPAGQPKSPQPIPLSATQLAELGALPPTERLAAYRKLEEQHQATVKGGKA